MLDFLVIAKRRKNNALELYPKFIVNPDTKDLMVRGGDFYAAWNEKTGLWSMKEGDVIRQIDDALAAEADKHANEDVPVKVSYMWDSDSGSIDRWHKYVTKQMRDCGCAGQLDNKIIFSNTETKKEDYASKKLPYPLEKGDMGAYEELISTLYDPLERDKLEWAVGAIISGDAKHIQKFIVLYGSAGSGKSTILNIIQMLFDGYCNMFDAKELTSSNNSFALESFKSNPLVSIQHDGDLSRIEDNTKLNSIVSHETMEINEKYKNKYAARFNSFLFMGTNKPVKITDAKSGLIRRLIDVSPSKRKIPYDRYKMLMNQVRFELGAIAYHCLERYSQLGESYYDKYVAKDMISATNDFYDFVKWKFEDFLRDDCTTLTEAWNAYTTYCDYAKVLHPLPRRAFGVELRNYFAKFTDQGWKDNKHVSNLYSEFAKDKFESTWAMTYDAMKEAKEVTQAAAGWLIFKDTAPSDCLFDKTHADCLAQLANQKGNPKTAWDSVTSILGNIDSRELHWVKMPVQEIVIDFDLKGKDGKKDFQANLEAANKWPRTYAELSKSGAGIHLHYIYTGKVEDLSRIYDDNIEIKTFPGNSSLRRKLTKCNDIPIATISSNLPLKGVVTKVVNWDGVKNEKMLRAMIKRDLNKEYMGATKPSIDHINAILEDAYNRKVPYDVTDLKQDIFIFALHSTNNASYCMNAVNQMKFSSLEEGQDNTERYSEDRLVFFDVEVFPNLFLINWKYEGAESCVRMINPSADEVQKLTEFKLIGFNNRKYDNHILYARMQGYTNMQLYDLSNTLVNAKKSDKVFFGNAYNLSYTDVYDFCSKKQSLKKWEIELGIHHKELGLPWNEPVPEERWTEVAEYCDNDVIATEAVFHKRRDDFEVRCMLAKVTGMTANDTTRMLVTKFIFGNDKNPQLVYTDLSKKFPGYECIEKGEDGKLHNMFLGEDVSLGGYVYAEPRMYTNVATLDISSMHPTSMHILNYLGKYQERFDQIKDMRLAIKHGEFEKAKKMLDGQLAEYVTEENAKALAQALKIVINSTYGYTYGSFANPFKHPDNKNNIVALHGALFMATLRREVQKRGYTVAHIKTDSIKIPDADPGIIKFVMDFGKQYGYSFEHESTYAKMCLVNDAVYIAKYLEPEICQSYYGYIPDKNKEEGAAWTATGTQFQVPYVFKSLFSHEAIEFDDLCETKSVSKGALYLDMNETRPDVSGYEKQAAKIKKASLNPEEDPEYCKLKELIAEGHEYIFVGRVGRFCPIKPGCGGGELMRGVDGNYYAATGTKDYRWLESEVVRTLGKEGDINRDYYKALCDSAVHDISLYGDFEWFASDEIKMPVKADFINVPDGVDETGYEFT